MTYPSLLLLAASLLLAAPLGPGNPSPPPSSGTASPFQETDPVRLLCERDGPSLHLKGTFTGSADVTGPLRYELIVEKQGTSGRSTSRQAGAFVAPAPGVRDTLSRVQVGVKGGDRIVATLTVHREARLLGEARLDTLLQQ